MFTDHLRHRILTRPRSVKCPKLTYLVLISISEIGLPRQHRSSTPGFLGCLFLLSSDIVVIRVTLYYESVTSCDSPRSPLMLALARRHSHIRKVTSQSSRYISNGFPDRVLILSPHSSCRRTWYLKPPCTRIQSESLVYLHRISPLEK